jgi:hypothetical protein
MIIENLNGARSWDCYQAYITFTKFLKFAETYSNSKNGDFESEDAILDDFKSLDEESKRKVIIETLAHYNMGSSEMLKFISVHQMENKAYISLSTSNNYHVSDLGKMTVESIIKCSNTSNGLFF